MNEQLPVPLMLPGDIEARCAERLQIARTHMAAGCWHWVEAGKQFAAIKEDQRRSWVPWCKRNGVAQAHADALIRIAGRFDNKIDAASNLPLDFEAMRLLASPSVSVDLVDEAISRAESGERITKAKAEEMTADAVRKAEEQFRSMVDEIRAKQKAMIAEAISETTERLIDDKAALEAELARLREAERITDVDGLSKLLCQMLGKKSLSEDQWRSLAQILGHAIAHGRHTYEPITKEQLKANEENLRFTSAMTHALETLAAAPSPEVMRDATWPVQRKMHKQHIPGAIKWLTAYGKLLERGN
jgi:hypothetical protein